LGVDSTIGRGFGTLTQSGVASTPAVLYEVFAPTRSDVMAFGTIQVDGSILWLIQTEGRLKAPAGPIPWRRPES